MSGNDYLSFDEFNRRSATPPAHTTPAALALALVAGVYTLFRFLDVLGYPLGRWIRRALHAMALDLVRAVSPAPSLASEASDDSVQSSGGMMGSLFGLGASALSKGVHNIASALSRGPSDVPPGLGNLDNSCYQNSVIQGLAALPALRAHLEATAAALPPDTDTDPDTTNAALLALIARLHDPAHRGHHFWIRGKLKSMSTFTQQDAQEYYSRILDELDTEAKAKTAQNGEEKTAHQAEQTAHQLDPTAQPDLPSRSKTLPLEGALAQRVGCTTCGYSEGLSLIPFNCITVSLGRRPRYDIRELLDDHTALEYIQGVECSKCTLLKLKNTLAPVVAAKGHDSPFGHRLRLVQDALDDQDLKDATLIKTLNIPKKNWVKSEKSKQLVVARAPKALVLHVNRSIFDETTFAQYKNNAAINYPATLDLGAWCLGTSPSRTEKPDLDPKTDDWPRDPNKSMLMDAVGDGLSPFQYRLRAAVTHFGTHGNGHYVCYRPHPRSVKVEAKDDASREASDQENADAEAAEGEISEEAAEDGTPGVENKSSDAETADQSNSNEHTDASTTDAKAADAKAADAKPSQDADDEHVNSDAHPADDTDQNPPEQWYRFSDDTVHAVPEHEAHQGNVFMLFYERIDPAPSPEMGPAEHTAGADAAQLPPATVGVEAGEAVGVSTVSTDDADDAEEEQDPASDPEPLAQPASASAAAQGPAKDPTHGPVPAPAHGPAHGAAQSPVQGPAPTHTLSPHTMRTAGSTARSDAASGRTGVPLVSAS